MHRINLIKIALFLTLCIEITNVNRGIEIPIYGNLVGLFMLYILLFRNLQESLISIFLIFSIFTFYFIINTDYYLNSYEPYKALFYSIVAIFLAVDFKRINYSIILEKVFFVYIVAICPLYILGIGVDSNIVSNRIQGLMSEPSALSFILTFLFFTYCQEKLYFKLGVVVFVSLLTLSLTVYINLLIFYFIIKIMSGNYSSYIKILLFIIFSFCLYLIFDNFISDYWLFDKLNSAITYIISGGESGSNTRGINIQSLIYDQAQSKLSLYFGNGPSFGVYFYQAQDVISSPTTNMPSILFFDFGLFGFIIGMLWFVYALFKLRNTQYYYLYISVLSYNLINTASGIVNNIYLYALLIYSIGAIRKNSQNRFCVMNNKLPEST